MGGGGPHSARAVLLSYTTHNIGSYTQHTIKSLQLKIRIGHRQPRGVGGWGYLTRGSAEIDGGHVYVNHDEW